MYRYGEAEFSLPNHVATAHTRSCCYTHKMNEPVCNFLILIRIQEAMEQNCSSMQKVEMEDGCWTSLSFLESVNDEKAEDNSQCIILVHIGLGDPIDADKVARLLCKGEAEYKG